MSKASSPIVTGAFASLRYRKHRDRIIELILLSAGLVAVFTTVAIVFVLFYESAAFFEHVSVKDFITDTMWTPLFADARYGDPAARCRHAHRDRSRRARRRFRSGRSSRSICPSSRRTSCAKP